jgi:hypothetical protein
LFDQRLLKIAFFHGVTNTEIHGFIITRIILNVNRNNS